MSKEDLNDPSAGIIAQGIDSSDLVAAGNGYISGGDDCYTISIDPSWSTMAQSITLPSTSYSIGAVGSSYVSANNYNWTTTTAAPNTVHINNTGIDMAAGTDITIDGKSLKNFMDKMEERLAILVPDPAKLEKFEALKRAYENYKLIEKLCQIDDEEQS